MILFNERPSFEEAWAATTFRVVMAGMGDDTTMVLAEMYQRGYEPDEIVFADTGSEHKHTYKMIEHLKKWCTDRNWSKVVVLHKFDKDGVPLSVIGTAERDSTLPGAAFGINADEPERAARWAPEHKWCQVFPLLDWGIGERESGVVGEVGLYYPGKSSCICCPHMNGQELYNLKVMYPEDYNRIKAMERRYQETHMTPDSSTTGMCRRQTIDQKITEWTEKRLLRGNGGCDTCAIQ